MSEPAESAREASTFRFGRLSAPDLITIAASGSISLLLLILILCFSRTLTGGTFQVIAIPVAVGATGLVALTRPRWILYGFIALCMVVPNELEAISIPLLDFMNVYPQDAVFAFLALITLVRLIAGKVSFHGIAFNKYMMLYLGLGVWAAGVGLLFTGNEYDNVFGDFRRSFFYFLVYFFALALTAKPMEIRYLKYALLAGSIAVIARGLLQAFAGDFVTRRYGDAAHIMNHFEVTFSTFAVYMGLANLSVSSRRSWIWITLIVTGGLIIVLGNFRTCWVGFFGGLSVMAMLLPRSQRNRLTWAAAAMFICAASLITLLWNVPVTATQSTLGENIAQKANWKAASSDTNVTWRLDSYRNAIGLWQAQPIIGRGLGEELEFYTSTSTGGSMLATGHRVHNSYLWLLMSLGISGFTVFVYVHWKFISSVVSTLRRRDVSGEVRVTLTGCLSFYAAIMVSAGFDVYLESSPPITIISVAMALCLLVIRYKTEAQKI